MRVRRHRLTEGVEDGLRPPSVVSGASCDLIGVLALPVDGERARVASFPGQASQSNDPRQCRRGSLRIHGLRVEGFPYRPTAAVNVASPARNECPDTVVGSMPARRFGTKPTPRSPTGGVVVPAPVGVEYERRFSTPDHSAPLDPARGPGCRRCRGDRGSDPTGGRPPSPSSGHPRRLGDGPRGGAFGPRSRGVTD